MTLALLACCALPSVGYAGERVVLVNGTVIEATSVTRSAGSVEIDLGFQILSVPAASIVSLESSGSGSGSGSEGGSEGGSGSEGGPSSEHMGDDPSADPIDDGQGGVRLYREAADGADRSLDANISRVGEAVVLVRTPVGLGSGFMTHSEGYLITNDHVVEGSTELTVVVYRQATDGLRKDEYKRIRIVATSELLDLALLKIEPDDEDERFVTVPLSDSNDLVQGEGVFAVGNPMGLERSLSEGIVALRSRLSGGQTYVQTTAALSPGNSGGPLFNMAGEVIGVNSQKIVSQGAEGLSFSIPVNQVKAFIDSQEAYAFDTLNANSGHRYYAPPQQGHGSDEPSEQTQDKQQEKTR